MSIAPREASARALLAAIADPAVVVDDGDSVVAWNPAAQALPGFAGDPAGHSLESLAGAHLRHPWRVTLAEPAGSALLVWPPGDDDLGPNEIALEKLDTIGRIAGGVSHDLMGPLAAVMGFADLEASDPSVPLDLRETATLVVEAAQRIKAIMQSMLGFSRGLSPNPELLALGPLVRDLLLLLDHATKNMEPRLAVPDSLPQVEADRGLLQQALLAILLNGLEAQGATWTKAAQGVPGTLAVSGRVVDDARGTRVRLAIQDGGPVVSADERPTLFSGAGGGRGGRDLAVARALVEQAGGRVSYEPVLDGNRIVVELPIAGTTLPPDQEPEAPHPPLVLICDPEPLIRTLLVRYMSRLGVESVEARDGREALAVLAERPVTMVIADLELERGGDDLYSQVIALRPALSTSFVFISGDPASPQVAEFARRTGIPVMPKPFDQLRLEQLVRDAIGE